MANVTLRLHRHICQELMTWTTHTLFSVWTLVRWNQSLLTFLENQQINKSLSLGRGEGLCWGTRSGPGGNTSTEPGSGSGWRSVPSQLSRRSNERERRSRRSDWRRRSVARSPSFQGQTRRCLSRLCNSQLPRSQSLNSSETLRTAVEKITTVSVDDYSMSWTDDWILSSKDAGSNPTLVYFAGVLSYSRPWTKSIVCLSSVYNVLDLRHHRSWIVF